MIHFDVSQHNEGFFALEWEIESNYIIHESGFTVIVEEGSLNDPTSIRIKQSEGFSAIEQAKLLREGMEFCRSEKSLGSKRLTPREHKAPPVTGINTYQTPTSEIELLEKNTPKVTVKKTRKIRIPGPTE